MEELEHERNSRASVETAGLALVVELATLRQPTFAPAPAHAKVESAFEPVCLPKREAGAPLPRPPAPATIELTGKPDEPLFAHDPVASAMTWPGSARLANDIRTDADASAPVRVKHEHDEWASACSSAGGSTIRWPSRCRRLRPPLSMSNRRPRTNWAARTWTRPLCSFTRTRQASSGCKLLTNRLTHSPPRRRWTPPPQRSASPLPLPVQAPGLDGPPRLSTKHLSLVYHS
jgi:hypothetical protein